VQTGRQISGDAARARAGPSRRRMRERKASLTKMSDLRRGGRVMPILAGRLRPDEALRALADLATVQVFMASKKS
jgi:hypothetical protein